MISHRSIKIDVKKEKRIEEFGNFYKIVKIAVGERGRARDECVGDRRAQVTAQDTTPGWPQIIVHFKSSDRAPNFVRHESRYT